MANAGGKVYLFLVRHGESQFNKANKFCGWVDADLSEKGLQEAVDASTTIKDAIAQYGPIKSLFTSYLKRAKDTLEAIRKNVNSLTELEVKSSWKLNERHYGALQNLDKSETAKKYGEKQVQIWRRSFDIPPPSVEKGSTYDPSVDPLYANVKEELPLGESLKLTIDRVWPFYTSDIEPILKNGDNVLVVAHGNTTRSILKQVGGISDSDIVSLEIPTAIPVVVEFDCGKDGNISFQSYKFLADPKALAEAQEKVKAQGKAK
ncbi:MAG: hypothetical protein MHPSP_001188 [Paramarteilia canceri]